MRECKCASVQVCKSASGSARVQDSGSTSSGLTCIDAFRERMCGGHGGGPVEVSGVGYRVAASLTHSSSAFFDKYATSMRQVCNKYATSMRQVCDKYATSMRHVCDKYMRQV